MPYRALTHNRVKSFLTAANATTHTQAAAINSQNGVPNSGPVTSQKNALNISNKQPSKAWSRVNCTKGGCAFLMSPDAYGSGAYVCGDGHTGRLCKRLGTGKGFPNATPQTSVGSTNTFARRAIARRAVTKRQGVSESKNCPCNAQIKNLKGQILKSN